MDLSKIPNRLRGKPYFCLMKLEQKPGKDKKDKVPYRTNGARADPTNPNHFTSLENVMKVFDKGGYDGIGIGLFDMLQFRGFLQKNYLVKRQFEV